MEGPRARIEIAGGIASGKTTLARLLQRAGVQGVFENFRRNPFYAAFYRNPLEVALETEITFLLQHYHSQKCAAISRTIYCADFSLVLDHAYASVTLPPRDQQLFVMLLKRVEEDLPKNKLLVHLKCSAKIELERIRRRGRRAERRISSAYLEEINGALSRRISLLPNSTRVITIDSNAVNFARSAQDKKAVVRRILG